MNKTELIAVIANRAQVTQKVAEDVLEAFTSTVSETLGRRGEKVVVTGFGTFEVRNRVKRTGKNPRTGELITVPEQKSPAFRAGKLLKEAVKQTVNTQNNKTQKYFDESKYFFVLCVKMKSFKTILGGVFNAEK